MALSDDDLELLQQQAVSARETADTPGWAVICDRIKAQVAPRQERMIAGRSKDWEQYQDDANWLRCALWVLGLPDEIEQAVGQAVERHESGE